MHINGHQPRSHIPHSRCAFGVNKLLEFLQYFHHYKPQFARLQVSSVHSRVFFIEKLLRGGEIEIAVCEGGIHVSVYMHVNVSINNDSTK